MDKTTIKKYPVMQVHFHSLTMQEALQTLLEILSAGKNDPKNHLVVTPNPEALMLARRNRQFLHILQNADLVLADGIGILLAARWLKLPLPERVPGCDITIQLLKTAKNHTCYLLGAAPGVAETAKQRLEQEGITVLGARSGYFNEETERDITEEIQALKPDILLVGMGMPKQEEWTWSNLHTLPCKLTLCVGGTIDILAGNVRRAPALMRRFGLEWFYRLLTNPSRLKRMLILPKFAWLILTTPKN